MTEPSEYVTAHEAAEITGLGYTTIRRRIRDGLLPATLIKRNRYAIRRSALPGYHPSLQQQIRDLQRDMSALKEQMSALINMRGGAIIPATPPRPPVAHPTALRSGSGVDGWPSSVQGRAQVIAPLIGRAWKYVASWPEVKQWGSYEDAVTWLADHKGITVDTPTRASSARHD